MRTRSERVRAAFDRAARDLDPVEPYRDAIFVAKPDLEHT
jgi:hypothetical protein